MKITVIGAGAIGSAIAQDLLAYDEVTRVQICDARARSLQELHELVQNPRLRSFQVDARDPAVLESIVSGSDCVIGSAEPKMNPHLAALCLSMGVHFCDLGGNDAIVRKELALHDKAREKSVWIVPNCGLDPGLVNILCAYGMSAFDEVEAAHLRVGDVPLHPRPPFNFRISWSAEKIIEDYTNPVHLIEDGTLQNEEPLGREESITFPDPFGRMEAFCTAGGLTFLADETVGTIHTMDHKLIRWPGHAAQMRFLLALGFGEKRYIDVRTHLTYRDVLVRRMRQRLGGTYHDAVLLRVLIRGLQDGRKRTLVYEMVALYDDATGVTAIKSCTSIPTAAIAVLIASKRVPGGGAALPEHIIPHSDYIDLVTTRGLPLTSTWYDGYRDIANPEEE